MCTIFALPLPTYQQPAVYSYGRSITRKRKRPQVDVQDALDDSSASDIKSPQSSEYTAVITPEDRSQRRLAGQAFDTDIPKLPFPHSKEPNKLIVRRAKNRVDIHGRESASTESKVRESPKATLHLQHLAAMTAVLHRCLMEEDYPRAGRAFGLILRDHIQGHDIDIRTEERWGIGGEILLRKGPQGVQQGGHRERIATPEDDAKLQAVASASTFCTFEGFETAKRYYESLSTQYPPHKSSPAGTNALDFYPAMYGLWIHVIHERGKFLRSVGEGGSHAEDLASSASLSSDIYERDTYELFHAREILMHMNKKMDTFPFSNDKELIRLRGMVASWIADLTESSSSMVSSDQNAEDKTGGPDLSSTPKTSST